MSKFDSTHKLEAVFNRDDEAVLVVTFTDGMVLKLRAAYQVDSSVYGKTGQWSAIVVQSVTGRSFTVGSGVDFLESDVSAVLDESTGQALLP